MKKVIGKGGTRRVYDTDTATVVAGYNRDALNSAYCALTTLYATRGGEFFLHIINTGAEGPGLDEIKPLTHEEARQWLDEYGGEVLVPAAFDSVEKEAEATVFIRLPAALKTKLAAQAKAANMTLNAWAVRCLERCAA